MADTKFIVYLKEEAKGKVTVTAISEEDARRKVKKMILDGTITSRNLHSEMGVVTTHIEQAV